MLPESREIGPALAAGGQTYFFAPGGRTGGVSVHFPLPVLLPIRRSEESRCVPVMVPDELRLMDSLPVTRPDAFRFWLLLPDPANLLVLAPKGSDLAKTPNCLFTPRGLDGRIKGP
jgi:hypothetical protein